MKAGTIDAMFWSRGLSTPGVTDLFTTPPRTASRWTPPGKPTPSRYRGAEKALTDLGAK